MDMNTGEIYKNGIRSVIRSSKKSFPVVLNSYRAVVNVFIVVCEWYYKDNPSSSSCCSASNLFEILMTVLNLTSFIP